MSIHTRFSDNMVFIEGRFRDIPPRKKITSFRMAVNEALEITKHAIYKISLVIAKYILVLIGKPAKNFCTFSRVEGVGVYHCSYSYDEFKKFHNTAKRRIFVITTASVTVIALLFSVIFPGKPIGRAAALQTWTQTNWSTEISDVATHTLNQTGWTKYSAKTSSVSGSATDIKLNPVSDSWVQSNWGTATPADSAACTTAGGTWDATNGCYGTHAANKTGWGTYSAKDSSLTASATNLTLGFVENTFADTTTADFDAGTKSSVAASSNSIGLSFTRSVSWAAKPAWDTPDVGVSSTSDFADLDNDGDPDMIIGENNTIKAYKNTGTVSSPAWTAEATWNPPDPGSGLNPALADLDANGTYDLIICSSITCFAYKNTGTVSSPAWTAEPTWNPSDPGVYIGVKSGDLDGNGIYDLMISSNDATTVYAYKNTGTVSSPAWTAEPTWNLAAGSNYPKPALADLDADGKLDLMVGKEIGITYAYKNTGTVSSPAWTAEATWNLPDIGGNANPAFADLDNDGDKDAMIGETIGIVYAYENTGTTTYSASGTLTSLAKDAGSSTYWGNIVFNTTLNGQTLAMKVRTFNQADASDAPFGGSWASCNAITSGTDIETNNCVTSPARYVQYQAAFSGDTTATPILNDVTIYYGGYVPSATLTSSPYKADTGNNDNKITSLAWSETKPANTNIKFQLRTGSTLANLLSASWCGPDNATPGSCSSSTYFTTNTGQTVDDVNSDGTNDQWIQYKAILESTDGVSTPTLTNSSGITLSYKNNLTGNFASSVYNTEQTYSVPYQLIWNQTLGSGNTIKFQIATSSANDANLETFYGPAGTTDINTDFYSSANATNCSGTATVTCNIPQNLAFSNGYSDQYIKYKAYFTSADASSAPTITGITFNYDQNTAPSVSISSASQINDAVAVAYNLSDVEQTSADVSIFADIGITLKETLGDSADPGSGAITVSDATLFPSYGVIQLANPNRGGAEQILYTGKTDNGNGTWNLTGAVRAVNKTKYDSHPIDTTSVLIKAVTVSTTTGNGTVWNSTNIINQSACEAINGTWDTANSKCSQYGTINFASGINGTPSPKSASWNVKTDLPGTYAASAKITVTANDNQIGNPTGTNEATGITIDTKNPVAALAGTSPVIPVKIDLNNSRLRAGISAVSGETASSMRFSASDLSGVSCTDESSVPWVPYAATYSWSSGATVYYQFKDAFCNLLSGSSSAPSSPQSPSVADVSYYPQSEWRNLVWWTAQGSSMVYKTYRTDGTTTLGQVLDSSSTAAITLSSISLLPSSGTIKIDNEEIGYTSKSGSAINGTITRGANNTLASAHASGTTIMLLVGSATDPVNYCFDEGDGNCTNDNAGSLSSSTTYVYKTVAEKNDGISDYSTTVSAIPSGDKGGIKDVTGPVLSTGPASSSVLYTSAIIAWTTNNDSNDYSNSFVKYGTVSGSLTSVAASAANATERTNTHQVSISGLDAGTKYYYQVLSTDAAGNNCDTCSALTYDFTTAVPAINDASIASYPGSGTAAIYWTTTGPATTRVYYQKSSDFTTLPLTYTALQTDKTLNHTAVIPSGLDLDSTYYYEVESRYGASDTPVYSSVKSFVTPASRQGAAPVITLVSAASNPSDYTKATVSWTTDLSSYSIVEYDTQGTSPLTQSRARITDSLTGHSVIISGLTPGSAYDYIVYSADTYGNLASGYATFTATADTTKPALDGVVSNVTSRTSATIYWKTTEASTTQVKYIQAVDNTTVPITSSTLKTEKLLDHYVIIDSGIASDTTYNYQILSTDAAGNTLAYPEAAPYLQFSTSADKSDNDAPVITPVTLAASIDDLSTSPISISSTTGFPSSGIIQIGSEKISYTGASSNTLSGIARGASGTVASAHSAGDVVAANVTSNSVLLTWTTNEVSDSYVYFASDAEYIGNGNSYSFEQGTPTIGTSHQATVVGLAAGTTYHYRLKSRDAFGNAGTTSTDRTFTTDSDTTSPSSVSNLNYSDVSPGSVTLTWTVPGDDNATGTASQYDIRYTADSTVAATQYAFNSDWNTGAKVTEATNEPKPVAAGTGVTQSMVVTGLSPNTTYYFAMKTSDEVPNTSSISNILTVSTDPQADTTVPAITNITEGTPAANSITITWDTANKDSSSLIDFETDGDFTYGSTQGDSAASAKTHSVSLTGLAPSTTYYYRVKSVDSLGNMGQIPLDTDSVLTKASYSFTTASAETGTLPVISSITKTKLSAISYKIDWTTDIASDSLVTYGIEGSVPVYPLELGSSTETASHSITLTNLSPSKTYNFLVKSRNGTKQAVSSNDTFATTDGLDTIPPIFTVAPQVSSVTGTTAVITWSTSEKSNSFVDFGTAANSYTSTQGNSSDSVLSHSVALASLTASTTYYFQIRSVDAANNSTTANNSGSGYTFTTTAGTVVSCPSGGGGGSSAPACPVSDTTSPLITDISVSDITFNSAAVSWKTDEDANSNVSYGKEKQVYDGSTSDFKTFSKTHKIVLTNLDPSTSYYFKVSSSDAKGNLAESEEQTFKTQAISDISDKDQKAVEEMKKEFEEIAKALVKENITSEEDIREIMSRVKNPPVISGDGPNIKNIKSYGATVTWTTDRKANSIVKYSPFSASSSVLAADSSWKQFGVMDAFDTNHEIDLMGLSPSTQYSFLVESQDVLGNTSKSNIKTFITSAASSIFGVNATDITLNSVVINWETANPGTSILEYGLSSVYGNSENKGEEKARLHSVYLSNLSQGTTYHFRARSVEESGNILTSDDYTFTTYRMPEITKYELGEVKDNSIEIKWTSNIPINSSIRYTSKETNETRIQGKPEYITDHAITIDSLDAGKSYSVEIQGADSNNNKASLPPFDVQTGLDIIPPELSQVRSQAAILSGSEDRVQAIVSWRTNELSTTRLLWDLGSTKGDKFANATKEDANLTTNHISVITQFKPGTVYRFRVSSTDKFGNTSVSQDYSILTPVKRQSVIQMIMGKFEDIFGWMNKIRK